MIVVFCFFRIPSLFLVPVALLSRRKPKACASLFDPLSSLLKEDSFLFRRVRLLVNVVLWPAS